MYRSKYRISTQSGLIALALIATGTLGLLEACSSDGNPAPTTPVITTGGSAGSAGKGSSGESSAGTSAQGGSSQSNAGAGAIVGDAGEGGEGGAGAPSGGRGGATASCPTSDVGFYNQPSKSQSSPFDNVKRLGTHDALPPLP